MALTHSASFPFDCVFFFFFTQAKSASAGRSGGLFSAAATCCITRPTRSLHGPYSGTRRARIHTGLGRLPLVNSGRRRRETCCACVSVCAFVYPQMGGKGTPPCKLWVGTIHQCTSSLLGWRSISTQPDNRHVVASTREIAAKGVRTENTTQRRLRRGTRGHLEEITLYSVGAGDEHIAAVVLGKAGRDVHEGETDCACRPWPSRDRGTSGRPVRDG